MKFWQKMLAVTLTLFVVVLDVSVIIVLQKSWVQNLEREIVRAKNEQRMLLDTLDRNLAGIASRGANVTDMMLGDMVSSYDDYYEAQNIRLYLWQNDTLIYPKGEDKSRDLGISSQREGEQEKIMVTTAFDAPYEDYTIGYQRDVTFLYESQNEINALFAGINIVSCFILAVALYVWIRIVTRPLKTLSHMSASIAQGNYSQRIPLTSHDEFRDLAENFNNMADAVERHISQLDETAQEKQRLVDSLAHELRTPLTSMSGFSQTLLTGKLDEHQQRQALQYIAQETARLKDLSYKLLELAVQRDECICMDAVEVPTLFGVVRRRLQGLSEAQSIHWTLQCDAKTVLGDQALLVSFLSNAAENAIHASAPGSTVVLRATREGDGVRLSVQDFGCGMTEEQCTRALEPFYRADKSRSRKHGGAGLGLSLCAQIAQLHGAEMQLTSEYGTGTVLSILLQVPNNLALGR